MKLIIWTIAVATFVAPQFSVASGTRGGGDVIEIPVNGQQKLELYDLVSQYTCDWKTGRQMIAANPRLTVALANLARIDWYLALSLRSEIESLDFCLTGSLLPIYKKFKTTPDKMAQRAAFRMGQNVLWDQDLANQLSARSRAFLMIHEASHAFLTMDMNYHERYIDLWSAVREFSFAESGAIDRDQLRFQLRKDNMEFPFSTDALDPYEQQIEFLLGDSADRAADILAARAPENLIALDLNPEVQQDLASWDLQYLESINFKGELISSLQEQFVKSTPSEFERLLKKKYETLNITLIALAVEPQLSDVKREELEKSGNLVRSFDQVYDTLAQQKVKPSDNVVRRPTVSKEFMRLVSAQATGTYAKTPIVDLEPAQQLATEFQGLARIVATWIKEGEWYEVDQTVTNNPKFYEALGLKTQRRELNAMSPVVTREKPLADEILVQLRDSLAKHFVSGVDRDLESKDLAKQFENRVNYNRFKGDAL